MNQDAGNSETSLRKEARKYLRVASLGVEKPYGLPDDETQCNGRNEDHEKWRVAKRPNHKFFKNRTQDSSYSCGSCNEERDG